MWEVGVSAPAGVRSTEERSSERYWFRSRWTLLATEILFTVAVVAFYSAVWRGAPFRGTDTTEYLEAAHAIATGHLEIQQPRTPGFPLFVLLVGTGRTFFIVSLLLHLAAVGLLAVVLQSMRIDRRLVAAFVLIAVLPSFMQKHAYLLTEGLFEFLMIAGFAGLWFGQKSRLALALSGVAFALATITRPQNQLLPFVIAAVMILYFGRRKALPMAACLLAPYCLMVGSLMVNNYIRYHDPNLTYMLGFHLGTRTVSLFEDIPDQQVRDVMVATRNAAYGDPSKNPTWTTLYTRPALMKMLGKSPAELARYMKSIHLHLILTHPLAYLEEVGRAFVHFWFPDLSRATNRQPLLRLVSTGTQLALAAVFWLTFLLWAGLSLGRLALPVPAWLGDPVHRFLYTAGMATIFYTAALCTALDMGEARYRSTVELVILFVIVVTADFLWKQRSQRTAPAC